MTQIQNMTPEQMQAEIARLQAENHKLSNKAKGGLKVSAKGAVSVYGLQRFPVTLYAPQWEKLLAKADEIREFIAQNQDKLAKDDDETVAQTA